MIDKKEKERYERMQLKNGVDLPKGQTAPPVGRKQKLARAYELLVLKTDEEYIREAEENKAEHTHDKTATTQIDTDTRNNAEQAAETGKLASATGSEKSGYTHEILNSLSEQEWRNKRKRKRLLIAGIIIALVLVFAGRIFLGPAILFADISAYEDVSIEIEGIEDKSFEITPGFLAGMKKTAIKVDVVHGELVEGEEPELGKAIGPTLETFLKNYDKTTDDFKSFRVYSENGDSKAYVQTMKDKTIVLSVANGRKPLGEKEAPLRIAIKDESTDNWFGWVRKIVFVKNE